MGKQINFYMSENIQTSFVEYLQQNQFIFLDYNAQIVEEPFSTNVYRLYLYKQNYGQLFMLPRFESYYGYYEKPCN